MAPKSPIPPPTTIPTIFAVFDIGESREGEKGLEVAVAEGVDVGVEPGRTKRLSVQLNSSQ